ncbi:MAG TPA: PaaI family thioesterase [Syntrophales bacterium]|nr:PaaI family thioesterase [Syntrophales bacterium]HOH72930.1 PaaI family thioesterase [Syntrophales bacterium]HPN09108.1 PaaI family thioesterase [Syntrophales bacterium]HPX81227.1 PaaI family thioesterase [Syntrophales bacterium]HQB13376.1 PaaI family thioesterase [Syntrophales bacterium]
MDRRHLRRGRGIGAGGGTIRRIAIPDFKKYLDNIRAGIKGLNPFMDFIGIEPLEIKEGFARFRLPVRPEYLQGAGRLQGGLMVALADEAIAHAMVTTLDDREGLTTIELKSNFLAAVSSGAVTATATVFKKGQSLIIGDCLLTDDRGRNVCRVSATFLLLQERQRNNNKLD